MAQTEGDLQNGLEVGQLVGYKAPALAPHEKKPSLQQFLSKPIPPVINLDLVLAIGVQQPNNNGRGPNDSAFASSQEEEKRAA